MEKTSAVSRNDRSTWPIEKYRLGEEPSDDLTECTTPAERLAMMWELSEQAWHVASLEFPNYSRATAPGRVLRNR